MMESDDGTGVEWMELDCTLKQLTKYIDKTNRDNGWYESDRTVGDGMALLHTEVSEAFEAFRDLGHCNAEYDASKGLIDKNGMAWWKPIGVDSELADVLIRLLDECSRQNIDLVLAVQQKMRYNALRGYRHGGKVV